MAKLALAELVLPGSPLGVDILAVGSHAVEFHAVVDEPKPELLGNLALQDFQLRIDKFDNFARFYIDHVIVMCFGSRFISCATVTKIMPVENAGFLEQAHSAVDCGDRDSRIDFRGSLVKPFDIGMVDAFRQHSRDHASLFGYAQSPLGAKGFDIDWLVHV